VPIAFLLAILLGYGRLNEDRELVALSAAGMGFGQLLVTPLGVGVVLSGLLMALTFTGEPWGLTALRGRANDAIKKNMIGDVRPGVFYEDLTQLTLYVEGIGAKQQRWRNVLIHDDRDLSAPLLVLAREGQVLPGDAAGLRFSLADGQIHRSSISTSDYSVVSFERGALSVGLQEYLHQKNRFPRTPKEELTPGELLDAGRQARAQGVDPAPFLTAFHWRLGRALAPLPFALLGAALAISRRQAGRARGFLLTLLAYVAYYVVARFFEILGIEGKVAPLVAGQIANVLFAGVALLSLYRFKRVGTAR